MTELYKNNICKLEQYNDKLFYLPLSESNIKRIESKLQITLPSYYRDFLLNIGLIQDLLVEIHQTESMLYDDFSAINECQDGYIPIGQDDDDNIWAIRQNTEDDKIYKFNFEDFTQKPKILKISFTNLLDKAFKQLEKSYKNRAKNTKKVICCEFTIYENFEQIISNIKSEIKIEFVDRIWKSKLPNNLFNLKVTQLKIDNEIVEIEKTDSKEYRIEFETPVLDYYKSNIVRFNDILKENKIDFTKIESGIIEIN